MSSATIMILKSDIHDPAVSDMTSNSTRKSLSCMQPVGSFLISPSKPLRFLSHMFNITYLVYNFHSIALCRVNNDTLSPNISVLMKLS